MRHVISFLVFMMLTVVGFSQEAPSKTVTPKQREKAEMKRQKAELKEQEKMKKAYRKMQSKSTKKSMRKNAKKSKLNRKGKADRKWFWQNWF